MTNEKFRSEIDTLKKFFELYCHDKHQDKIMHEGNYKIPYNGTYFKLDVTLCDECNSLLSNSISKLQNCPHDPKPMDLPFLKMPSFRAKRTMTSG